METKEKKLIEFIKSIGREGEVDLNDSDLVSRGNSLGLDLISFAGLRAKQEDEFADEIREGAINKLERGDDGILEESDLFYAGSIDFMVCDDSEGKTYFLLETNGGSNRGLSIITEKQQKIMYDGYFEAIDQALTSNKRGDDSTLVLIGVPINDGLIHEKIVMLNYFRKKLEEKGRTSKIYSVHDYSDDFESDVAFLVADYKQLSPRLSFSDNWVLFNNSGKINVLIGDGIARRLHDEEFHKIIKENFRGLNTLIVNPIFKVTDDKSLTYLASFYARKTLEKYNLKYLLFTKAFDESDLIEKLTYVIENYDIPFIIKPNGGSGGAGVIPISSDEDPSNLKVIIERSKDEFFNKFMKNRDPYPYTIQEMAKFKTIEYRENQHTYDLRIYLAQRGKRIIPIGGLARIARGDYCGTLNKEEFVVNLSGYGGTIEVERGRGFSKESAEFLDLTKEEFTDIFCIGSALFSSITKNYQKIIQFEDWDEIIGE